ncbi:DUF1572 family protein [Paludisphaera mucosa]|uniref:DUF1572 family protein n=1 Tax=Paludisphaera mucosa TaxID=3030827 RepID=A0ABT6F7G8_9BACT|nr:DUF1572 family protein [Paludisphaera mucosa]MDG3003533.1 DUF1572 family protein [Paludisphaera mucosa]
MSMGSDSNAAARCFLDEARARLEESVGLIHHCVGQLDDAQLWWRPREGMNSIANLSLHLAGNLRQRYQVDLGGEPDIRDRFGEFTDRGATPKAELLRRFDIAVAGAIERLDALAPEDLVGTRRTQRIAGEVEKSVLAILFQTLTHLNGHAQEILHITRMQLGDRYAFQNPDGVPPEMRSRS